MKSIEDSKFLKVVPITAKVIYALDKKILSISKNSFFCKQEIYKMTEVLTTGLVIPSGTKHPPAVALTQWCKWFSKVPGLQINTPDASSVYIIIYIAVIVFNGKKMNNRCVSRNRYHLPLPIKPSMINIRTYSVMCCVHGKKSFSRRLREYDFEK